MTFCESMKKIVEFNVEDIGPEDSQFFRGRGTCFSKWDDVAVGEGQNQQDAVGAALEILAHKGWEISPELEAEFEKADTKNVGLCVALTGKVKNKTIASCEAKIDFQLVPEKESKPSLHRSGNTITLVHVGTDAEDILQEIFDAIKEANLEISWETRQKLTEEGRMYNDHDYWYHVAIYVRGEGAAADAEANNANR